MTRPRKREEGNFLAGMGVGVLIGLAVSLGIAFYLNRTPIPFMTAKPKQAEKNGAAAKQPVIAGLPQSGSATVPATTPEKPKFDFYRILPGSEEPVTEKEIRERLRSKGGGQQEAAKDVYFIQAGSFQNPADADNQKARLAILGFDSSVEPANLPDKGTWYRVRMGPYAKLDEINKVRQALAQNGIDASLIKVKDQ
ncbi:MAG TPA: SPOR domain-containing protein [Burkholderiales bacterium]|nr:SPOR domain-containing protein [Burkholderiales bacterium]